MTKTAPYYLSKMKSALLAYYLLILFYNHNSEAHFDFWEISQKELVKSRSLEFKLYFIISFWFLNSFETSWTLKFKFFFGLRNIFLNLNLFGLLFILLYFTLHFIRMAGECLAARVDVVRPSKYSTSPLKTRVSTSVGFLRDVQQIQLFPSKF